jgi:apolipoprotein N-acyltransferase
MKQGILFRGLGAVASGLMLAASFPNLDLPLLAWVALVPLVATARTCRPRAAAGYGLLAGTTFFIILNCCEPVR